MWTMYVLGGILSAFCELMVIIYESADISKKNV